MLQLTNTIINLYEYRQGNIIWYKKYISGNKIGDTPKIHSLQLLLFIPVSATLCLNSLSIVA